MISQPVFEAQFKRTWAVLEQFEVKPEKINAYYEILKYYHPEYVSRAFAFFAKVNREEKGKISFPTGPEFLLRVEIFKNQDKPSGTAPVEFEELSDEEAQAEYELMAGFMEAYPFPEYPPGGTSADYERIDRNYKNLMRKAGIKDVDGVTHPKVAKLLMADLKKQWEIL